MKKGIALIVAFGFLLSPVMASGPEAVLKKKPASPVINKVTDEKQVKGLIDNIVLADPAKGIRPRIEIISGNSTVTFIVKSTTTIYDRDWKAVSLDNLNKGKLATVRYKVNKEGFNEALSIKPSD